VLQPDTTAAGLGNQTPQLEHASGPGWQFGHFGAYLADPIAADSPAAVGTMRWGGIYGHSWFIDPAAGVSVVAMTNTGLEGSDGIFPLDIRDAIYWPT
jgi:CubicO group peptidase (beta-lactamase class C family)